MSEGDRGECITMHSHGGNGQTMKKNTKACLFVACLFLSLKLPVSKIEDVNSVGAWNKNSKTDF